MKLKKTFTEDRNKERQERFSINFKRLGLMIARPCQVFTELESENHKADWKSPILVIAVILLLASLLAVTNSSSASTTQSQSSNSSSSFGFSNMGPGGMQSGGPMGMGSPTQSTTTSESASTDETATSSTSSSSTLLSRILSALGSLLGFTLTWLLIGSLANLISISFGGQGNTKLATVFAAWTCVPFGIRSLMQIMYVIATGNTINAVGLSGFVTTSTTAMAIFLEKILAQIDIYTIWQAVLLAMGVGVMTKLDKKKSILIALISVVMVIMIKALLGLGFEKIASINISSSLFSTMMR